MRLEPIRPTPETTERKAYQIPKLEHHGEYIARVGIRISINNAISPNEFWDTESFWDDLNRPSF